jgi:ATP-dependent DNA ligase
MLLRERVTRRGIAAIEPCLPSPVKTPPAGPGWIHEIKQDGFRIMARRDVTAVRLITRKGNDFTGRFPQIAASSASIMQPVNVTRMSLSSFSLGQFGGGNESFSLA